MNPANNSPLFGLVLAGGKSKRMKTDKGSLNYFGKTQVEHSFDLLQSVCDKTFVSCREDQLSADHIKNLPTIPDKLDEIGPSGGILSAMEKFPNSSWLVLACDMPFASTETIQQLVDNRDLSKAATCLLNPEKNWPEPLCTIWEAKSYNKIKQFVETGKPCPRKILMNIDHLALTPINPDAVENINTPEEYQKAAQKIPQ